MDAFELKTQGYLFRIYRQYYISSSLDPTPRRKLYTFESLGPCPDNKIVLNPRTPEYVKQSIRAALDLWESNESQYSDFTIDEFLAKTLPD